MKTCYLRCVSWLASLMMVVLFVGCTIRPALIDHTFSFDAHWDSPNVKMLDFRYGSFRHPGARMNEEEKALGELQQSTSINAAMPRPETLYVKWRNKRTGYEYEDNFDLKSRLPDDLERHQIEKVERVARNNTFNLKNTEEQEW